ncbi:MAG: SPASM domain-containing protein [Bdellovibrio sp.]|nr:SPASM domain-containing protein [Bdellovibrio sp.]
MKPSKKRFAKVNIEISNVCNLQCSFCPEVIRANKLMDVQLFEKVIQQVTPLTELVCFHLMGDPLVHPKLAEFVAICEKYGAKIFFVTNGVLLKDSNHELLLSPAFHQVNFSLHSFFDNFKGKDPTLYLDKIFTWTQDAFEKRPDLYINYRLWNLQDVRGSETENVEMLRRIENHFNFKMNSAVDVRKQKSLKVKNKLYLHFDTEFIWPSADLPVLGTKGTCYGLTSHFGILADGTVVPCCLDKEAAIPLGHVQRQSILEILDSPKAMAMLSGFKQNKLVENLCQRCQYIERFQ